MRKTTKLTTLEKWPKKSVETCSPTHPHAVTRNPGEKAQAKTSKIYGYDTLLEYRLLQKELQ